MILYPIETENFINLKFQGLEKVGMKLEDYWFEVQLDNQKPKESYVEFFARTDRKAKFLDWEGNKVVVDPKTDTKVHKFHFNEEKGLRIVN